MQRESGGGNRILQPLPRPHIPDLLLARHRLIPHDATMLRSWPWWLTFLLLSITLGYFWLLSHDTSFARVDAEKAVPVKNK